MFYTTPPPEQLASGSRQVSRRISPSILSELFASGSRPVSRQSCSPLDPAARQVSRSPVDPAQYPARSAREWIPSSIPPQRLASGSRQVSRQSGSPASRQSSWPVDPPSILPERLASVPSCFECALRLGKGDAFVLLWVVNKQLRLIPRQVCFWKGLGIC